MNLTEGVILVFTVLALHIAVFTYLRRRPRKNIVDKHVVVTGGSSGIGLWVAIHAAKMGAHVTIIARNLKLLEKAQQLIISHRLTEKQHIAIAAIDLTTDYANISKRLTEVEQTAAGKIYMLVNCAGAAICGTIEDLSAEQARFMMDVNYFGTFFPTKYVLANMKKRGDGIIIITASQAAMLGIYGYGAYGASKFALRGLAETVAMEAGYRGVTVTLALPADTDTPGLKEENKTKPLVTQIISGSGGLAKPEHVAKQMLDDALVSYYRFAVFCITDLF